MSTDDSKAEKGDHVAEMARLIYEQMNIEPRQMHIAIKMAKSYMDQIRRYLIEEGLRRPEDQRPLE